VPAVDPAVRAAGHRGAAFADLIRPHTARLPLVPFLVAGVSAGQPAHHLVGGALLIVSSFGLAAAYNDLHDVEVDRANGFQRPLVTGALTVGDARKAIAACAAAAVMAQLLLFQPLGMLVTLAAIAASVAYSAPGIGLERRGVLGTAMLAVTYLVLPLLLAGRPLSPAVLVALVAGGTATLLYKDVRDEAGDRLLGKRTPLVRWGARRMDLVAAGLGALALALGLSAAAPGWWTVALVGALVAQLAMAMTGTRRNRLLSANRLLTLLGLIGLAIA
jgi:4-hydroxybenzoate polyprenyltransferase